MKLTPDLIKYLQDQVDFGGQNAASASGVLAQHGVDIQKGIEDQARDSHGRWVAGGGSAENVPFHAFNQNRSGSTTPNDTGLTRPIRLSVGTPGYHPESVTYSQKDHAAMFDNLLHNDNAKGGPNGFKLSDQISYARVNADAGDHEMSAQDFAALSDYHQSNGDVGLAALANYASEANQAVLDTDNIDYENDWNTERTVDEAVLDAAQASDEYLTLAEAAKTAVDDTNYDR